MTTERQLTSKLHAAIQTTCYLAVIIKHSDRFTSGIPDSSVTWRGRTSWLEMKRLTGNKTVHDELRADQSLFCTQLGGPSGRRCWVVCYHLKRHVTLVYDAVAINRGQLPQPNAAGDLHDLLRFRRDGVIEWPGFAHMKVAALVAASHTEG